MQIEALSSRRLASTLTIALVPIILGLSIYGYWLYEYFVNYNISPAKGLIPTIGFGLLVVAVPANFLGVLFLYIPMKKNIGEVKSNPSLKRKFIALFTLLALNYVVAAGVIYNYNWLSGSVSIELTHNYKLPVREIRIVLPNGDGLYMNVMKPGATGFARVFSKGEGPIELIITDSEKNKFRGTIIEYVTSGLGGTVRVSLEPDYSLKILSGLKK